MTDLESLPLYVNGRRMDTWRIYASTLTGRMNVAPPRTQDVVAPGVDGVIPSIDDDYDTPDLDVACWVRSTDDDGNPVAGQDPKTTLQQNLSLLAQTFQPDPSTGTIDVGESTGLDQVARVNVCPNPTMSAPGATNGSILRTNLVVNSSFEAAGANSVLRSNLCVDPRATRSVAGWSPTAGGTAMISNTSSYFSVTPTVGDSTSPGQITLSCAASTVPSDGTAYASAVLSLSVPSGQSVTATLQVDTSPDGTTWTGHGVQTYATSTSGGVTLSGTVTGLTASQQQRVTVIVKVPGASSPTAFSFGQVLVCDQNQQGPFFDGDSTNDGSLGVPANATIAWTGTAGASTSTITGNLAGTGWTVASGFSGAQDTSWSADRSTSQLITATAAHNAPPTTILSQTPVAITAGAVYSAAVTIAAAAGTLPVRVALACFDSTSKLLGNVGDLDVPAAASGSRVKIENLTPPSGTSTIGLVIYTQAAVAIGAAIRVDAAQLEASVYAGSYFDGATAGCQFTGTADTSSSQMLGTAPVSWVVGGGTLAITTAVAPPAELAPGSPVCEFTSSGTANPDLYSPFIVFDMTHEFAGSLSFMAGPGWGSVPARVECVAYGSTGATINLTASSYVVPSGTWQRLYTPILAPGTGAAKLRLVFFFNGTPANGAVCYVAGAALDTADAPTPPTPGEYFDANTSGVGVNGDGTLTRVAEVRHAACKVKSAAQPTVVPQGGLLVATQTIGLYVVDSFWTDPQAITFDSGALTQVTTLTLANLQGSTARITDALILVTGGQVNTPVQVGPQLIDVGSGQKITLQNVIGTNTVWMIDCATGRSMTAPVGSDPTVASQWTSVLSGTNWSSTRCLLPLTPILDPDGVSRIRLTVRGTRVQVTARRKWL